MPLRVGLARHPVELAPSIIYLIARKGGIMSSHERPVALTDEETHASRSPDEGPSGVARRAEGTNWAQAFVTLEEWGYKLDQYGRRILEQFEFLASLQLRAEGSANELDHEASEREQRGRMSDQSRFQAPSFRQRDRDPPARLRAARLSAIPNGDDKNYQRLVMACAVYRQRFGEWPTQARLGPGYLHSIAHILDERQFARLALHLELRTMDGDEISVGGKGVQRYGDVDHDRLDDEMVDKAHEWLGLQRLERH